MITLEQLKHGLNPDVNKPFQTANIDHDVVAIMLLRNKIPYDACKSIIGGGEHDVLYLPDIDEVLPYLDEGDVKILADCNVWIDEECDSLALFV